MNFKASPGKVSAAQLASDSGFTERHLRDLAKKGVIPSPKRGVYDQVPALLGLLKYRTQQCEDAESGMAAARKAYVEKRTAVDEQKRVKLENENASAKSCMVPVEWLAKVLLSDLKEMGWAATRIFHTELAVKILRDSGKDFGSYILEACEQFDREFMSTRLATVASVIGQNPEILDQMSNRLGVRVPALTNSPLDEKQIKPQAKSQRSKT